jgi:hypothetical protein
LNPPENKIISEEAMVQAYEALAALGDKIPEEVLSELYSRLSFSRDELKEEAREEVRKELEQDYELDAAPMEAEFIVESDETVTLGMGEYTQEIRIRYLNEEDFERLAAHIPDVVRHLYKRGPKYVKQLELNGLFGDIIKKAFKRSPDGKPSRFKIAVYQEFCKCLSNPKTGVIITPGYLLGCKPSQIIKAIKKMVQVNRDFFIDLWAEVPGDIRTPLAMSFGITMTNIKTAGLRISELLENFAGIGGILNGGLTNLLTLLPQSMDSLKQKSGALPLSASGGTALQSSEEKTEPGTSTGSPTKKRMKPLAEPKGDQKPPRKSSNGRIRAPKTTQNSSGSTEVSSPDDN